MEAFLRYNAGRARAGIALSRAGISVSPSPTDLRPVRFFRRVGPSARSSLSTNPRRDLGLEEYYPRFMAQGLDDVEEARTSRTLDSVLETVGMDCNPGYGRPEISRLRASHTSLFAEELFFVPTPERNAVDVDFSARADDGARRDPSRRVSRLWYP
jgi:hypothetical protein